MPSIIPRVIPFIIGVEEAGGTSPHKPVIGRFKEPRETSATFLTHEPKTAAFILHTPKTATVTLYETAAKEKNPHETSDHIQPHPTVASILP
jgi:hypothetical protein